MTRRRAKRSPEESTAMLVEYLLRIDRQTYEHKPRSPEALFRDLWNEQGEADPTLDWDAVTVHWWELARIGAIAIVGGGKDERGFSAYVMTDFGRALLQRKDVSPHDRAGYLSAIRGVAGADAIAVGYADEAVGAWHACLFRASAVMLGVACERLVFTIAQAIHDAGMNPFAENLKRALTPPKDKPPMGISEVFRNVRGAVLALEGETDSFDRDVSAIFQHARALRNASGHPSGREVTREEALAGLLLFPTFQKQAIDFIERIRRSNP